MSSHLVGKLLLIKVSGDKKTVLQNIAKRLLKEKLVACVNILSNVDSLYIWKGKVVKDKEYIMFLKTTSVKEKLVYKKIITLHNYEVPEVITTKIDNAHDKYSKWLIDSLKDA